jgi:hypothetical protein
MATITYDPTEYQESEFSEEEQDSLRVGEELATQDAELLAGKYRSAEELEQGYIELQQKFSSGERGEQEEPQAEEGQEEQPEEEEDVPSDLLERLWNESEGDVSPEILEEIKSSSPEDIAAMYLEYRNSQPEAPAFAEEDITQLKNIAGGDEGYGQMMAWATDNLNEQEIQMFDDVMETNNPMSAFFAIQALNYRYQEAVGYEGRMLTGSSSVDKSNAFRSQAELVRAMEDSRYEKDAAYREDVRLRLENSNI